MQRAAAAASIDLASHRSVQLSAAMVASSQLLVTMTRQQLVDVTLLAPDAWSHCFTLADFLRRADASGARRPGQPLPEWVAQVGAGRSRSGVLVLDLADDVTDPMGRRGGAFERTVVELDRATTRLAALLYPSTLDPARSPA